MHLRTRTDLLFRSSARCSSRASTSSSSSSSRLRTSLAPSSDWSDMLSSETADDLTATTTTPLLLDAPSTGDTPPTSPEPILRAKEAVLEQPTPELPAKRERRPPASVRKQEPASKGDLRSFFAKVSPRKRARKEMEESASDGEGAGRSKRKSATLPGRKKSTTSAQGDSTYGKSSTKSKAPKAKLEQLFLDPFETAGHSTLSCAVCSLSYSRTPEDMDLHTRHHKKVVGGCDWVASDTSVKGVTTLDEGLEWGEFEGGKVVMVDANAEGVVGRRVSRLSPRLPSRADRPPHVDQGHPLDHRYRAFIYRAHSLPACRVQAVPLRHSTAQGHSSGSSSAHRRGLRGGRHLIFIAPVLRFDRSLLLAQVHS